MAKLVSFDVGLTLLHTSPGVPWALYSSATKFGYKLNYITILKQFSSMDTFYENANSVNPDFWLAPKTCYEFWYSYYSEYCRLVGIIEHLDEIVEGLIHIYTSSLGWALYDDVMPLFRALKSKDIEIAVITNWGGVELPRILADLGLSDFCSHLSTAATTGKRKPDPALFLDAYNALGVQAKDVIHVGDSLERDGVGAELSGACPLIIDRLHKRESCPYDVIRNLDEVIRYI